ncbi:hypothetical protein GALMADRAFT_251521 [Galerina marginata CBS 339.88]|uniref:Uncharacterized protein n=1 Tax=Galerina marginata (strain CBS 339.88) TaxID=685588 RepID=A0A067T3V4_GALM3|nr:hypothetical protein GALMADRAFT_251521 [Galerina marginata CBS 339.88]
MNSPPDPGSPSPSTPSSGSPPPEEVNFQQNTSSYLANLTSHISATFSGNSSKRRLPAGSSFGAASSARDAKTRRRGESGRQNTSTTWEGLKESVGGKKEKDELIDNALVEYLRKEIGDPFLEPAVKG